MREVNGDSPKNARIKINYSKNKPKVTFSYPSKKHQINGSLFYWVIILTTMLMLTIFMIYSLCFEYAHDKQIEDSTNYNLSNFTEYLNYIIEKDILVDMFNKQNSKFYELKDIFIEDTGQITFFPFLLFGIFLSCIIYFPFKKSWTRFYPKFQAWTSSKKIKTFKDKDIKYNQEENNYFCELPIFANIILDYNATEDFSKYLELFEIREHDFKYYLKPRFRKRLLKQKKGKDRVKKKEINEGIWYARFYFKQKPIKGKMDVIFK